MGLWQTFLTWLDRKANPGQPTRQWLTDQIEEAYRLQERTLLHLNSTQRKLADIERKLTDTKAELKATKAELMTALHKNLELMERREKMTPQYTDDYRVAPPDPKLIQPTPLQVHPADSIKQRYVGGAAEPPAPAPRAPYAYELGHQDKPLFLDEINNVAPPFSDRPLLNSSISEPDTFGFPQDTDDINAQQSAALGSLGSGATELSRGAIWGPPDTPEPQPFFDPSENGGGPGGGITE